MSKSALTITIVANMTSNYSEGLGNIASVQKVFRKGKVYTMRSRESLKNAVMVQAGMYDDLETQVNGATQKFVDETHNATNVRALEGGYMNTAKLTYVRNSSIYFTDAIACNEFVNETRFHNNLYLANNFADANGKNLQQDAKSTGLMPYQYEYDKSMKVYSMTIDLDMIGTDENFECEAASKEEKAERVRLILQALQTLSLVVKGNLDNAEPIFAVGGISNRMTHYFENVVHVDGNKLAITQDLLDRIKEPYACGLLLGDNFDNEQEIAEQIKPMKMKEFFENLEKAVNAYYGVA